VAAGAPGRGGEVLVDVEEGGAGDVPGEVELAAAARAAELPAAIHELVSHVA
jgi:hypothetical protein